MAGDSEWTHPKQRRFCFCHKPLNLMVFWVLEFRSEKFKRLLFLQQNERMVWVCDWWSCNSLSFWNWLINKMNKVKTREVVSAAGTTTCWTVEQKSDRISLMKKVYAIGMLQHTMTNICYFFSVSINWFWPDWLDCKWPLWWALSHFAS